MAILNANVQTLRDKNISIITRFPPFCIFKLYNLQSRTEISKEHSHYSNHKVLISVVFILFFFLDV